ncbi:glucans biosynthesis glucosyltransferase MdoH [Ponticaulis sp.]|uniref:glucans biosynthesis glucosyltransferase MdoH n=1 Tax=Ponticaulis sp. TaxID=2020902 RepID=UPI0025F4DBF2|nr:glucans biosynthesis glucosyltransferase MdoH [Ponticaulis sp.]
MSLTYIRPPECPLHMPEQGLTGYACAPVSGARSRLWRKAAVIGGGVAITVWLIWLMFDVLSVSGLTQLEWALLAIFSINIGWIGFAFASSVAGFLASLFMPRSKPTASEALLTTQTAILFPIYNESVTDVFATVEATASALASAAPDRFECFILSDTVKPDIALEEEEGFQKLRAALPEGCRVYYRRRTINLARKAGNIDDFVSRWGGRYDHMLIFDADSYMSANTLIELARRMEAQPEVGLIQTIPKLIGGKSLFARAQQFAGAVYGPVLGRGISFWSQNEGNYWGHNAIIRTKAFADAAGLPVMPGRAPFGGHILSHDFVEAALLRRAGWKVCIAPDLGGSYEEGPQTLIDLSIRDRRWCQGNLQHTAVLARARGISFTNRLHFSIGIMSYLASPLWLTLILVGMALSLQNRFLRPEYFSGDPSLTPSWPVIDPALALSVFFATLAILLLPKVFGVIVSVIHNERGKRSWMVIPGALIETIISALVAPLLMAAQTASVIAILRGQDSGWVPQQRGSDGYRFADVARRHALTTLMGVVLTGAALAISPVFAAWLLPASLGMIFAIPLSYWSGKTLNANGMLARLLATREDFDPPEAFSQALSRRDGYAALSKHDASDVVIAPDLARRHACMVDHVWPLGTGEVHVPLAVAEAKIARADNLQALMSGLSDKECMALLNDPDALMRAQARFAGPVATAGE